MPQPWINRLTVFGPQKELAKLRRSHWRKRLQGRYWELQETMRTRWGLQFETQSSPVQLLQAISARWPRLTFVLEFENETDQTKGLVKAKAGVIEVYKVRY